VAEGTPGAAVVGIKRVNELDFYNLFHKDVADQAGITTNKLTAYLTVFDLKKDEGCYKEFRLGRRSVVGRYSQKALEAIARARAAHSPDEVWKAYRANRHLPMPKDGSVRDNLLLGGHPAAQVAPEEAPRSGV
jgi:hypothetical protein